MCFLLHVMSTSITYWQVSPAIEYGIKMMNSYFEQGGFYGQTATGTEQAYRFPLGLASMAGVPSPYATAAAAAQTPTAAPSHHRQDNGGTGGNTGAPSPYDSSSQTNVASASPKSSSLYSSSINDYKPGSGGGGGGGGSTAAGSTSSGAVTPTGVSNNNGSTGSGGGGGAAAAAADCKDQNGYSSLSKELQNWGAAASGGGGLSNPVRPSVCSPDPMARYATSPSAVDAASASAAARDRWMNTCTAGLTSQQPQLQQTPNHAFYPWMAIAGRSKHNLVMR